MVIQLSQPQGFKMGTVLKRAEGCSSSAINVNHIGYSRHVYRKYMWNYLLLYASVRLSIDISCLMNDLFRNQHMKSLCCYSTRKNIFYNFRILVYNGIYLFNYRTNIIFTSVSFYLFCVLLGVVKGIFIFMNDIVCVYHLC